MTHKITAEDTLVAIQEHANTKASQEVRFIAQIDVGQVVRQGDIYIHCVPPNHKHGPALSHRQLAFGSTNGARHIAEPPAQVYEGVQAPNECTTRLLGPCIICPQRALIAHPEHAHVSLPPGAYQVTHQMDARDLRRVQD